MTNLHGSNQPEKSDSGIEKEPVPEQSCQSPNSTSNFSLKSPGPGIVTPFPNPKNSKKNSKNQKKQANQGFGLTFLKITALKRQR